METIRIGRRTVLFRFPEMQTNLFAVYGEHRTYLCDTFLGPEPMELVKAVFRADGRGQPLVVFNSHHHWDHVWGNCAFPAPSAAPPSPGALILAHDLCRVRLERSFAGELEENRRWARGSVTPRFPDLTFSRRVVFPDDEIEFIYTPGHTDDSASCLDRRENIVFVGDNVEEPIPYLEDPDLARYAATLERYLALNPVAYVAGHGREFPRSLIEANLDYVRKVAAGGADVDTGGWGEEIKELHRANLATTLGSKDAGG